MEHWRWRTSKYSTFTRTEHNLEPWKSCWSWKLMKKSLIIIENVEMADCTMHVLYFHRYIAVVYSTVVWEFEVHQENFSCDRKNIPWNKDRCVWETHPEDYGIKHMTALRKFLLYCTMMLYVLHCNNIDIDTYTSVHVYIL